MLTISITFTHAATGTPKASEDFSSFWLLLFAIALLDDAERREKDMRKKRLLNVAPAKPKPLLPAGPR